MRPVRISLTCLSSQTAPALVSAWIVVALWDQYRLITLGVLAAAYFIGCVIALVRLKAKMLARPHLFAASLTELQRDEDLLRS